MSTTSTKPESDPDMLNRLGTDAVKWAAEFNATAKRLGYSDMDEGWLTGWFANAIMRQHDELHWRVIDPLRAATVEARAALAGAQAVLGDVANIPHALELLEGVR